MATDTLAPLASASFDVPPNSLAAMPGPPAGAAGPAGAFTGDAPPDGGRGRPDPELVLANGPHRDEIVKRLRRAEGQLRGIVRMLEEGQGCLPISQQLMAVRKALDATMARITINYLEQEMAEAATKDPEIGRAIERVGLLVGRIG
jgi:DNA-binding FrmR family transcriptional regulator